MKKIDTACIVDDDPIYLFYIKKTLAEAEICEDVLYYSNGKEAYENLKMLSKSGNKMPDVILLDLNMPIWDGWQFLDEFSQIPSQKETIIYLVTSSIDEEDRLRAKSYGLLNNYIVKPVTKDNLVRILKDMT